MMNNLLNGMFGKVGAGMCRLSMSGGIAVKTSNGYKSYNVKTGRLTNCDNFAFDIATLDQNGKSDCLNYDIYQMLC